MVRVTLPSTFLQTNTVPCSQLAKLPSSLSIAAAAAPAAAAAAAVHGEYNFAADLFTACSTVQLSTRCRLCC
jgi:hypothetical protein